MLFFNILFLSGRKIEIVIFIGEAMFRFSIIIIILFCENHFANSNIDSKASKMFFFNEEFGVIITGINEIMLTNDRCNSWTKIKIDTKEILRKVFFSSSDIGWIIGDSSIFKTQDGGYTWDKSITFRANQLHTMFFINENIGFVGGEFYSEPEFAMVLNHTTNSGKSWEKPNVDSVLANGILDFSFVQDSVGIAVGYTTLYKTYDFGKNWNKLPINFYVGGFTPGEVQIIDENDILLFGGSPYVVWDGEILMTNNSGLSWNVYGSGKRFIWGIYDYFVNNLDSVWITNGQNIFATTNKGINWKTIDIKLEEFSFLSNSKAYGLSENSILYTENGWESYSVVDSVLVSIEETEEIKYTYKLYQNYPNPFNPSTKIRFEIPKKVKVNIRVYSLLGELITELLDDELNSGIHEINFNASNLPSGVYLYQINTSEYIETHKCIFLK